MVLDLPTIHPLSHQGARVLKTTYDLYCTALCIIVCMRAYPLQVFGLQMALA